MKKAKVFPLIVLGMTVAIASGCGDTPYSLTETEEAIVANYAAHVITKFNTYQSEGLTYVDMSSLDTEETETEEEATEEVAEETDTQLPEEGTGASAGEGAETAESTEETAEKKNLNELFGTDSIEISYEGAELTDSYVQSSVFDLYPDGGNQLLIVNVRAKNTSKTDAELDILSKNATFSADVDNGTNAKSMLTILTNDFTTYQDTVKAGTDTELVIVFQVSKKVQSLDSLVLSVELNGENFQIIE